MSITIDGLRFHSPDIGKAVAQLQALRPQMRAESRRRRMLFLARRAVEILDQAALGLALEAGLDAARPLRSAAAELAVRQNRIRSERARDPEVDHSFELVLIPHAGQLYGAIFVEDHASADALRRQTFLEDFSWWDNSDRPDSVAAPDWESRGVVWRDILAIDPDGRLGGAGVTFGFLPWEGPVTAEELVHFAPGIEARAKALARGAILAEQFTALHRPVPAHEGMRMALALERPENRVLVAAAARDIATRLPEITAARLRQGLAA